MPEIGQIMSLKNVFLYISGVVCTPALFYAVNLQLYGKRSSKSGHKIMAQLKTLLHKVVMKGFTSLGIISQNLFKVIKF